MPIQFRPRKLRLWKRGEDRGDEVPQENIIKGYEVGKGEYIELDPEELEAVAIESKRTLEIDEFVDEHEALEAELEAASAVDLQFRSNLRTGTTREQNR